MNNSKYIVDPNGERRAGCFGNAIRYGVGGGILALLLWVLFSMCGCKSQCVPELIETHDTIVRVDSFISERVRDSIVYRDRQDSTYIYEKDSVSERQRGDTIYVTKWKVLYKYIYQSQTNSQQTSSNHTQATSSSDKEKATGQQTIVRTERYIPSFYKFTMWFFWIIVVLILLRVAWYVLDKIPATHPYIAAIRTLLRLKS